MRVSRLSQVQLETAIHLYEQGDTFYSVAQRLSCAPASIRDALSRHGVNARTRAESLRMKQARENERRERAIRLYREGWSLYQISNSCHMSYTLLRRILPDAYSRINDLGKVGALWSAGWSLDMIAEEFHTSREDAARAVRRVLSERGVITT